MIWVGILIGLLVIVVSLPYVVLFIGDALAHLSRDVLDETDDEWRALKVLRNINPVVESDNPLAPHPDRENIWMRR